MEPNEQQQLVSAAQAGDRQAFARLYDLHMREIYDFLYFRTHHTETAQDLASQTFLKALSGIHTYKADKASFRTWLYRIARNSATDHYRSMKSTVELQDAWDLPSDADVQRDAETALAIQDVRKHMAKLSQQQRDIITLRLWQGKTHGEIADILGLTEASSKVAFSRAMQRLRKDMPLAAFIALLTMRQFL